MVVGKVWRRDFYCYINTDYVIIAVRTRQILRMTLGLGFVYHYNVEMMRVGSSAEHM